jgi:hypothetical protein
VVRENPEKWCVWDVRPTHTIFRFSFVKVEQAPTIKIIMVPSQPQAASGL